MQGIKVTPEQAQQIENLLKEPALSQEDIAKTTNTSARTVRRVRDGYFKKPRGFNPLWDAVNEKAKKQRAKGMLEYGKGLEDDNADINTRLDRIEEELIDALMYIEHLREVVK